MKKIITSLATLCFLICTVQAQHIGFYVEGFENLTFPPAGWEQINVTGGVQWERSTGESRFGQASAYMSYDYPEGEDWLVSPPFTVSAGDVLSFYFTIGFSGYPPDELSVRISTTGNEISDFTDEILNLQEGVNYPASGGIWDYHEIPLSAYAGQTIYVAFQHTNEDGDGIYIDQVMLGTRPQNDVSVLSIDVPDIIGTPTITPEVTVMNNGVQTQTFTVQLEDGAGYVSTGTVTSLPTNGIETVTFDPWSPTTGTYTLTASAELSGDEYPGNNTLTKTVTMPPAFPNQGWTAKTPLPDTKWASAIVGFPASGTGYNDRLMLLAGINGSGTTTGEVLIYNPEAGSWTAVTSVPQVRQQVQAYYFDGKVYLIGGYALSFSPTATVSIYDIANDSWTTGTPMPKAVGDYAAAQYNDSLMYVISGYDGTQDISDVQVYNAVTDTWHSATPFPGTPVAGVRAGISKGKIVVVGGYNQDSGQLQQVYTGEIDDNDFTNITWTQEPDYPGGTLGRHAGISLNDEKDPYVYFTAGDPDGNGSAAKNDTWAFNVDTMSWEVGPQKPTAVSNIMGWGSIVVDGMAYIAAVGGYDGNNFVSVNEWLELGPAESYTPSAENVLYVNQNVSGGDGSGNSWENAIPELADALKWTRLMHDADNNWLQNDSLQIYIAKGTYKPLYSAEDGNFINDGGRNNSFVMVQNVQLYGGFDPANNIDDLTDTRILPNLGIDGSILSGDIGLANDKSDNSYNVLISSGDMGTAILDGFTITEGYANDYSDILINGNQVFKCSGSGIYNSVSSPNYKNLVLYNNQCTESGGGMFSYQSLPNLQNIIFKNNQAKDGGGLTNQYFSSATLINVAIVDNSATTNGSGMYNVDESDASLINVTLAGNSATVNSEFDGVSCSSNSEVILYNSIVWDDIYGDYIAQNCLIKNQSDTSNGNIDATNLSDTDIFIDPVNGDYSLLVSAAAVNAGNNTLYTNTGGNLNTDTDLAGNLRLFGTNIDLGAFEYFNTCTTPTAFALANVTTESVDLTWTAGDTEAVWEVNYGAPNFDPNTEGTTETVNDDPEFTLDGLTAETDYEVYLRAVCGADDESDWVGPESFTTLVACPTGDFTFTSQAQIDDFGTTYSHCIDITLGNITVQGNDITNVDGLSNVTSATGNLTVENNSQLTDITGFANITSIGGNLKFEHNTATTSLSGFASVETIGGYLSIWNVSMTSLQGLNHLTSVGGYLQISSNPLLEDFDGINALTSVNTNLFVEQNPVLENLDGLTSLTSIGGNLYINSNTALTDISGVQNIDPDTIGGTLGLYIANNTSLSVCNLPNLCTYLLGSGNRTIVNNLAECLNEAAVQAACGAELPFNETQEIYTLTIQDAVEASDCDVQSTVVIPSGDYTTETVDTTAPCWDIFFTVGASPGCATIGSVTLDGSDTIEIEIEGLTACTEYDQYEITNDLTLGGAALDVQFLNGYEPDFEDSWIIYNNTFINAVNGTFAGLAEGATFTVDGFEMQISYVGGDGNDIVLTATDCPDITTTDVETNQEEDIVTDCEYEFTWTEPTFTGGCGITVTRTLDPVYTVSDNYVAGQVVTATTSVGVTTVTYTAEDDSGNEEVFEFTLTANDVENPEITCIIDQTVNTDLDECTYTHNNITWDATADDNCSVASIEYALTGATTGNGTSLDGVEFNLGETMVTWTVTDGSDNEVECSFTVTVEDNQDPEITCIANQTVDTDTNVCTYTHSGAAWDATATDNCSVASIEYVLTGATLGNGTSLDGVVFNLGVTTVTWTVTDGSGNTDVCDYTITVEDNQSPEITCIGNQTVDTDLDLCTYTHSGTAWDATATDNCSVDTIEYVLTGATLGNGTSLDGVVFNLGVTTVTWTVTDGSGNTDVCDYTITVEDNQSPEITCIGNQTVDTDLDLCTYTHSGTAWDATATDNCSITSIEYELTGATTGTGTSLDSVIFNLGETTVTWTVTDGSGNTDVCDYTITVEDNQAPAAICTAPFTIALDFFGEAFIDVDAIDFGSFDNCSIAEITIDKFAFDCSDLGENVITLTVIDDSGNISTCTTVVTVIDDMAPQIVCPNDITVNAAAGSCQQQVFFGNPSAYDNCDGFIGVTQTEGLLSGSIFTVGVHQITFEATDSSGNSSTCSFTITVVDNQAPIAVCQEVTLILDADGQAILDPGQLDGGSTDNCDDILTFTASQTVFDCSHTGENMIELTVTDAAGNSSSCMVVVTVVDDIAPVVVCADPITISLDENGFAEISSSDVVLSTDDNCGIDTIVLSQSEFGCDDLGVNEVTITVTDFSGNSTECVAVVTVEDLIAPTVSCVDVTLEIGIEGIAILTPEAIGGDSFDNCEITVTAVDLNLFDCEDVGSTIMVTYYASDTSGNLGSCTAMVTIVDALPPALDCPEDMTVQTDEGSITYTLPDYFIEGLASATDNCTDPVTEFTQTPSPGTLLLVGTHMITLTATDVWGNTGSCSFELTVEDSLNSERPEWHTLTMYPNPAEFNVTISNPTGVTLTMVSIYDLHGRLVNKIIPNDPNGDVQFNVEELPSAVYMIRIVGENGNETFKRLIRK